MSVVNSIGLVLDIVGIILLFVFSIHPLHYINDGKLEGVRIVWPLKVIEKWADDHSWSVHLPLLGVFLVVVGFSLQLVSQFF